MLEFEQQAAALSQSSESIDNFEELLEQKQKEYLEKQRHYEDVLEETVRFFVFDSFEFYFIVSVILNDFKKNISLIMILNYLIEFFLKFKKYF